MKIRVNKAHFPVTVLGPGRRIGIWLQGCSIRCRGCISQDTWAPDPGREMTVVALMRWCREVGRDGIDGITLSGGEPFDQPAALLHLLAALQVWREEVQADFDILCYSGYPLATLQKRHARILAHLDALIPEPYVDAQPPTRLWRGSANQGLALLSPRGRQRYAGYLDTPMDAGGKRIQAMVDGGQLWVVGIPGRGDLSAVEARCRAQGLRFDDVSWRQ
jgi:anaerobic ribonucleoside-triphosphate reductase activating protein